MFLLIFAQQKGLTNSLIALVILKWRNQKGLTKRPYNQTRASHSRQGLTQNLIGLTKQATATFSPEALLRTIPPLGRARVLRKKSDYLDQNVKLSVQQISDPYSHPNTCTAVLEPISDAITGVRHVCEVLYFCEMDKICCAHWPQHFHHFSVKIKHIRAEKRAQRESLRPDTSCATTLPVHLVSDATSTDILYTATTLGISGPKFSDQNVQFTH